MAFRQGYTAQIRQVGSAAWRLDCAEKVRPLLQGSPRESEANTQTVVNAAAAAGIDTSSSNGLRSLINELIAQGKLHYGANFQNAFDAARELVPYFESRGEACERQIIKRMVELRNSGVSLSFSDPNHVAAAIEQLGQEKILQLSDVGRQQEMQARGLVQTEDKKRELIGSIMQGKATYPYWSPQHGQVRHAYSTTLHALSIEELRDVLANTNELRRKMGLNRDEQRAELRQFADEQRGHKVFREGDADSLTMQNLPEGATSPTMDRRQSVAAPQTNFINPATGQPWTRKEIISLAKNDLPGYRKMLRDHSAEMTAALNNRG